jgi:phospholipase C
LSKSEVYTVEVEDTTYKKSVHAMTLNQNKDKGTVVLDLSDSFHWYDVAVKVRGNSLFGKRYAGRVETGRHSKTDPLMGRVEAQTLANVAIE